MRNTNERGQLSILILVFGLLLGAYVRFQPTQLIGFPVTDGGLFYEMTKALQAGHYVLPTFVQYNGIDIPFAYPPLGFYVTALISDLFQMPLIEAFRWVPAVGSVSFTVAFYFMASAILKSQLKGVLATVFFALLPRSISWYVMGGGITRSPGIFFLILTLFAAYKLFTTPSRKYLLLTILFASGVVLSHPEAALHAVFLCLVLWLFYGRSKEGIKNAVLTALVVLLLTAPFFAVVISHHGLDPYLNASQTGFHSPLAWLAILTGSFADEKFVTLISALALLGLVLAFLKRDFTLIAFLFLPAIVDPRSAASISILAWAMLAAVAFADVIFPGLYRITHREQEELDIESNWHVYFMKSTGVKVGLTALIFYAFFGAVLSNQVYPQVSLTQSDRDAMAWIADSIPAGSRFVIVTGETEPFSDAVSEWFPSLAKSISLATVQGYEWLPGGQFEKRMGSYSSLQTCMNASAGCVEEWVQSQGETFDYILVSRDDLVENGSPLVSSLSTTVGYEIVYQQGDVLIFKPAD